MAATFYHINTTLVATGAAHQSDYWPDGDGQQYAGYVTSMRQYCAELRHQLTDDHLRLYIVTADGNAELISNDDQLRHAVHELPDRGVLAVTAVAQDNAHSAGGNGNGKRRRRAANNDGEWNAGQHGTAQWYDQAYSSDEDGNSDGADKQVDNEHVDNEHVDGFARVQTSYDKVSAIVERFDAHPTDAECYHCDVTEWRGARYTYATNSDYCLCADCYKQLGKSQKKDWLSCGAVWASDAPEYPLYRQDEATVSPDVRHLQYILTRIGFMPLSATNQLVGSYQSNTEHAVRRFRQHYAIHGDDMTVYNGRTAKQLGHVVRQLRKQGHLHI